MYYLIALIVNLILCSIARIFHFYRNQNACTNLLLDYIGLGPLKLMYRFISCFMTRNSSGILFFSRNLFVDAKLVLK
jgi:hypothetical protein